MTTSAGPDQTIDEGVLVTLAGSGQDSSGAAVAYSWTQTAGPVVALAGQATATATFTAPSASGVLTFRLQVQSVNGAASCTW